MLCYMAVPQRPIQLILETPFLDPDFGIDSALRNSRPSCAVKELQTLDGGDPDGGGGSQPRTRPAVRPPAAWAVPDFGMS